MAAAAAADGRPALGFIGLGIMGGRMARRLLDAGHPLTVWNRTAEKIGPLVERGARAAGSPAEVAAASGIVFLCVADTAAVEESLFGAAGVAAAGNAEGRAAGGRVVVDHSTILPAAARALAARLRAETGMGLIDAPVTGGAGGAADGTLVVFAGGEEGEIERVRPAVAHLSRRFVRMGPSGAGQAAKMVNQVGVLNAIQVVAEMIRLAEDNGVDTGRLVEVLEGGYADSRALQVFGPRMIARDPEVQSHMRTSMKDLDLVVETARESGTPLPHTGLANQLWRLAIARVSAEADTSAFIRLYG